MSTVLALTSDVLLEIHAWHFAEFGLAKSLMSPSTAERPLTPQLEEELVIAASREFYDNAESGNLHKGTMKLAFEW